MQEFTLTPAIEWLEQLANAIDIRYWLYKSYYDTALYSPERYRIEDQVAILDSYIDMLQAE